MAGAISTQYHDDEIESVADVEHSLPTPEGQRVASALDNGHSASSGWTKRKKGIVFGSVGIVVCVVLIIAISVSLAGNSSGGMGSSSGVQGASNPQTFNAVVDYLAGFQGVFGDRQTLTTAGTPQNMAAIWMANDAFTNVPTSDVVEQAFPFVKRYALAVLYYALSGPSWTNQYNFLTHTDVCDRWQQSYTTNGIDSSLTCGVRCDATGHVSEIFLPYNGLVGSIPTEIHLLPALTHLSMYGNGITGTLPATMQTLTDLEFLSMESNFVSGSVPTWLGLLTKLRYLNLGYNRLMGALPSELNGMVSLIEASFEWNQITSNVHGAFNGIVTLESLFLEQNLINEPLDDKFLAGAASLFHLDISDNKFQGTLPPHLVNLYLLDVRNNTFSGTLPNFAVNGNKLVYLAANNNKFNGPIPTGVGMMTDLIHFDVSNNNLSGPIPNEIGNMTKLQYLFMANNPLLQKGIFPALTRLSSLKALSLRKTGLIGPIPDYLGSFKDLVVLDLSENFFTGSLPTNLDSLRSLGYLAAYSNKGNLAGDVAGVCQHSNVSTILLDCTYNCTCCKTCCADNCTTVAQKEILGYLVLGYQRTQMVFSEDVQPQQIKRTRE